MNREDLFNCARAHGWKKGKAMEAGEKSKFRSELVSYLQSPGGQEALGRAPSWLREKPVEEIVELLMSEVDGHVQKHTPATADGGQGRAT